MKRVLLHLFLLACIVDVSAQQSTNDKFVLSSIKNSQGEIVDTLIADGMARQFVISLNGSNRKYTAFNVDITFPKGLSVGQTAAGYTVTKPEGADIYSGTQHAVYSNLLSVTKLRIACFSSELENLSTESGEILEIQFIPSKSMKTGKYTLQFSEQNLTAISGNEVQKYVPEASEYEFYVITLSDAFAAYKTQKKEYVATLGKEDDSQAVKSLITKAQTSIQNLSLSNDLSLAENKARVDAIVEQLVSDIAAQRAADQLAAAKANFESYKTTNITAADNMLSTGDGNEVIQLVADAKSSITSLTYDEGKTLEENKAHIDAIIEKLTTDIAAQRAADKADFETYKTSNSAAASALIKDGDSDAVKKLISDAKTAIIALAYDESKTLADNKARVDAIMNKLTADVEAQRKADQLAADKADFEQYKSELSTSAGKMISSGDGNAVQQLISNAQAAITALTYDESKTLADNKARVDAIMERLASDVEAQRKADQLAADKAAFEHYKSDLSTTAGKMISSGDGSAVQQLIANAQSAIAALRYDESKSLADNKARVDAIIEKLTTDIAAQRAADKANFEAYKTSNSAAAQELLLDGDGDDIKKLVGDAQAAIAALTYDESKTLADNKARIDAIMEKLVVDVAAQRSDDQLAADKAAFGLYKTSRSNAAHDMLLEGDSEAVQKLVNDAQTAIAALTYDESKTLADNKARVDAIMDKLTSDVEAQRKAEQLEKEKSDFDDSKSDYSDVAEDLIQEGDGDDVQQLINEALAAIAALPFDESLTLEENKARIDAILAKLTADIEKQRKLAADKVDFEQYKTSRSATTNELMAEGDGNDVQQLIANAQAALAALTFDENKTLAENKAIVDSIIDQLVVSIQEQRSIDSIAQVNGEISSGDVNVYTLSGKKVSRITKPGIYIINGKKMKLK